MGDQEKKDNGKGHHGNSHRGGDHHAHMVTGFRKRGYPLRQQVPF